MIKITELGWTCGIAMIALMVATGFQTKSGEKFGNIDLVRVKQESEFAKKRQGQLVELNGLQQNVIDFVRSYRVFTKEQASRFKDLSLKVKRTPAEEEELTKIKNAVIAADKAYKDLTVKANPTPAEAAQLRDYAGREQAMEEVVQGWVQEFDKDMSNLSKKVDEEYFKAVDSSVKEIGSKQAYTLIFSRDTAPYAANDVTDELIKAVNKK